MTIRRSFLPPIPEFSQAAELLSLAADALLVNDLESCGDLLVRADLKPLREFSYLLTGPINPEIHRQSHNPVLTLVPKEGRPRMPSAARTMEVFARDGYRCRFCESKVIVKDAHRIFARFLPAEARLGDTNDANHFGLATLTATIDHLVPYSRGGDNSETNLVTACGPCQYGRNRWTLEEVGILNPFDYPPIIDKWDGLTRLLVLKSKAHSVARRFNPSINTDAAR
ncbi:MAG: HNH endonuclease [Xanthomonadales bacterium]|nr:HNH endonuclease [Xanthomonadales bacterium]